MLIEKNREGSCDQNLEETVFADIASLRYFVTSFAITYSLSSRGEAVAIQIEVKPV